MARDDTPDIVAAFLIGAVLGIGATLLLRDDDGDVKQLLHTLGRRRQRRSRPARALAAVRDGGMDIVETGRRTAAALRADAEEIVASARNEIMQIARKGARQARNATHRRG